MSREDRVRIRVDASTTAELSAGLTALVDAVGEIDLGCRPIARPAGSGRGIELLACLRPDQLIVARTADLDGVTIVEDPEAALSS